MPENWPVRIAPLHKAKVQGWRGREGESFIILSFPWRASCFAGFQYRALSRATLARAFLERGKSLRLCFRSQRVHAFRLFIMKNETWTVSEAARIGTCSSIGVLFLVASVLTVTTNGPLLFVIFKDPLNCFRRPFAVLIAGLAATNFLFGAVVDTTAAKNEYHCVQDTDGKNKFDSVADYFIDNSATLLVFALSVDRLLAVVFPFFYRCSVKSIHACIAAIAIWSFSLAFSLIQLTEFPEDIYDTIDVHLHVTFVLTATAIIYCVIHWTIRKRRVFFPIASRDSCRNSEQSWRNLKREREFALTAFLILLALVITQIPYLVMIIVKANCESCLETTWYFVGFKVSNFLLCGSVIANPFLYAWRVKRFRNSFMIVFCKSRIRHKGQEISLRQFERKSTNYRKE